jgi:hypothetical protein
MREIVASVGESGVNRPEDVAIVQTLLNTKPGVKLAVDKRCGPLTILSIRNFQKAFLPIPDGRVDPGGVTWKKLTAPAPLSLVQLPQAGGFGYYSYSPGNRQYGTSHAIQTLRDVADTFRLNTPVMLIGIGDISFANGGHMDPHVTHQHGTNADIRPLRTDNKQLPVTITDATYSSEKTKILAQSLLAHKNVRRILFNDTTIPGVHFFAGHHNHMHVEMRS